MSIVLVCRYLTTLRETTATEISAGFDMLGRRMWIPAGKVIKSDGVCFLLYFYQMAMNPTRLLLNAYKTIQQCNYANI